MRTLTLTLVILGAASATGGEYRWLNVNHYPEDLIASPYLWSAIRIEDPQFTSYRIAADDFELTATTRIQRITFWSVEIGLPKIFGGDWYVYADAGGMPGALVAHAAGVPLAHELTGYSHVEGPIWSNVMNTPDLMLPPGRYFLAYRTYQGYVAGGKNNNTAFSTVWRRGASRAWWNFGVLTDGTVTQPWQLLQEFNTVVDNEWSFLIEGQTQSPWPPGDLNCDGNVDFGDINPFVLALTNPAGYQAAFPQCDILNGDINGDGRVDFGDINPFVRLLTNPS